MKNIKNLFLIGLIALAAVITFAGCPTEADDDGPSGPSLPASKGANELSGKTYFEYQSKTVFSATAADASSGTYSVFEAKYANNQPVLEAGKYTYEETETGAYSWDETAKTVALVPEKIAQRQNGVYGAFQTRADYKAALQAMVDGYKETNEAAFNEMLQGSGFSSTAEFIEYMVNEAFAQKTNTYSFSGDAKALFLEKALPANKGTNELAGQTYYGMTGNNNQKVKDTNKVYTFTANGTYSFVDNNSGGNEEPSQEGKYAVDNSNAQNKRVYLQPTNIGGKTRLEYYTAQTAPAGYYVDEAAARAARTNGAFSVRQQPYNSANDKKTIGYEG
jgi:hypothetical protein